MSEVGVHEAVSVLYSGECVYIISDVLTILNLLAAVSLNSQQRSARARESRPFPCPPVSVDAHGRANIQPWAQLGKMLLTPCPPGSPWAGIRKRFVGSGGHGQGWAAFQTSKILKSIRTFYTWSVRVLCTLQLTNPDQKSWFGASLMAIIIIIITNTLVYLAVSSLSKSEIKVSAINVRISMI